MKKFLLILGVLLFGCKEEEAIPIGPISKYENIPLGLEVEDYFSSEYEIESDIFLLGGRVPVGRVQGFVPNKFMGAVIANGWVELYNTTLYFDLSNRRVFQILMVTPEGFLEADCQSYGEASVVRFANAYPDAAFIIRSQPHGRFVGIPRDEMTNDGFEKQNILDGGCPYGFRLTPWEPTSYEVRFTNGYLYEQVVRDSDLLKSPIH